MIACDALSNSNFSFLYFLQLIVNGRILHFPTTNGRILLSSLGLGRVPINFSLVFVLWNQSKDTTTSAHHKQLSIVIIHASFFPYISFCCCSNKAFLRSSFLLEIRLHATFLSCSVIWSQLAMLRVVPVNIYDETCQVRRRSLQNTGNIILEWRLHISTTTFHQC